MQALLSWGLEAGVDLDRRLLRGEALSSRDIENYALWLERRLKGSKSTLTRENVTTFNAYLTGAEGIVTWFSDQYFEPVGRDRSVAIESQRVASQRWWRRVRKASRSEQVAPDLSDHEISEIETFLRGASKGSNAKPRWVRAYLIWRLAIEFGFRIGEILALRLEDCPTRVDPTFRVVRIEDRTGKSDPRGLKAPRPKTLGRALAPVISNTVFPRLVVDYQADHRLKKVQRVTGQTVWRPVMAHTYLLVSDTGEPLPSASAKSLADAIAAETGVPFNWHLARHAFFNRAYAAVANLEDPNLKASRMQDLVYWGGWRDSNSLNIYTARARRERARTSIAIWGGAQRMDPLA
ncbi:site-specific integrase [Roseivivax lentus]|nr:site-specific integrase [Roseivivax lentus]